MCTCNVQFLFQQYARNSIEKLTFSHVILHRHNIRDVFIKVTAVLVPEKGNWPGSVETVTEMKDKNVIKNVLIESEFDLGTCDISQRLLLRYRHNTGHR